MATPRVALAARVREEDEAQKKKCRRKKLGKVEAAWLMNLYDGLTRFVTVDLETGQVIPLEIQGMTSDEQPGSFAWRQ